MKSIVVRVPVRAVSANVSKRGMSRGARMAQVEAAKKARFTTSMMVRSARASNMAPPLEVYVTRISFGKLDDDNLAAALKHVLDGVADALGVDDKTFVLFGTRPGIRIHPRQRSEGRGRYGVEIEMRFA